jgi:hypothetical protein
MNRSTRFALAGLETGVSGALAMLAWLALASVLYRRTVWWIPNLFARVFFGGPAILHGFTRYTAAGIALDVFVYGAAGSLFGLVWRDRRGGSQLVWTGVAIGLAVWYVLFRVLWSGLSPAADLYTPDRQILIGNLIWGLALTQFPKSASRLEAGAYAPAVQG